MGMFDWFTSGPKAAEKVLDAGVRGLDALVFTDEERAELSKRLGDQWIDLQKALGEETTTRSVTRRIMAFAVVFPFVSLVLLAAGVYPWMPDYAGFLIDLADSKFGWLVVGVGAFYFGPHMLGRMKGGK